MPECYSFIPRYECVKRLKRRHYQRGSEEKCLRVCDLWLVFEEILQSIKYLDPSASIHRLSCVLFSVRLAYTYFIISVIGSQCHC